MRERLIEMFVPQAGYGAEDPIDLILAKLHAAANGFVIARGAAMDDAGAPARWPSARPT